MTGPRCVEERLHEHWRARLKADAVLHESRSAHQHIVILENGDFGRMLLLDGVAKVLFSERFFADCRRRLLDERMAKRKIAARHYNPETHLGAFMLPTYVRRLFEEGVDTIEGR